MPVDETAQVAKGVGISGSTYVWGGAMVRERAVVGSHVVIGRNVYIGPGVTVGNGCRLQNGCQIFEPTILEEGVFVGPNCVIANDRHPRAIQPNGGFTGTSDWAPQLTHVKRGASLGASVVVVGPAVIGEWAMVGAGAQVSSDVLPHSLMVGNPAMRVGWVGRAGHRLVPSGVGGVWICPVTGDSYELEE